MPSTKDVFGVNKVYERVLENTWINYCTNNDPGELWGWGVGAFGKLGINNTSINSSPTQISGTDWIDISASTNHVLGTKSDNTLWVWGCSGIGEFGLNLSGAIYRSSPTQIPGTSWCKVGSSCRSSFAIKTDNTLWAWGCNADGRLGTNNIICYSSPTQIPGTTWCDISSGHNSEHKLALKTDNTLWVWGYGFQGQLGGGTRCSNSSPMQLTGSWCNISTSAQMSAAIKTDNTLWVWGNGNLGLNLTRSRSSPVQIPGTSWCKVAIGETTNFAIKTDNTLWGWGYNVGNNTTTIYSSPIQIPGSWCDVCSSSAAILAIKTDSTLWAWGDNSFGQAGQNNTTILEYSSPIQIPGNGWVKVDNAYDYNFAKKL